MDQGKAIVAVIGAVAVVSVIASISRSFWFSLMGGGPIVLGLVVVVAFLAGVFVGKMR